MNVTVRGFAPVLAGLLLAVSVPAIAQEEVDSIDQALLNLTGEGDQPAAGRYADDSLGTALEFDLVDGWGYGWALPFYGVWLEAEFDGAPGSMAIAEISDGWLYERPCPTEGDETYGEDHADIELTAESVISHWEANPYLQNEGVVPVTIAGVDGYQLDVEVRPGRRCLDGVVPLWGKYLSAEQTDAGPFFLVENERSRIVAFEADGKDFVIVIGGDGADGYAGALALGLPTIESLALPSAE